ncbi:hypothetical protein [Nocardia altamirensis]|uniref:hypothetical protein n=1 Tax=Nocardia altamirensis TaxID=472158 RepID=UPI001FDF968E|nr:hypothetical protein [Nocardia altamirensis]
MNIPNQLADRRFAVPVGDGDSAELRAEIAAFYQGFGQPGALLSAFRRSAVLVPLTEDDRVSTHRLGGIDWLYVFTTPEEYAAFVRAAGVQAGREYRYHSIFGRRLLDKFVHRQAEPTGVLVDIAGAAPMAFPPELEEE